MKPAGKIGLLLLWVAIVLLRVVHLDADAYARLSWSSALLTDEGFYVHNARNLVLFGHARTDDFNNALIMPLLHGVQVLVFSLCGVGAVQARSISVVSSLLTLLVFFCALRRAFSPRVAWIGLVLLGLDPVFTLYNRLALMDTPACLPLCCAFYTWIRFSEREAKRWLFACGLSLAVAYLVRGLAAVVVPVPFLSLLLLRKKGAKPGQTWQSMAALAVGMACVLLPYLLLWYLPNHHDLARVNAYYMREQLLPRSGHGLMRNILQGLFDWQRGMMPFLLKHSPILFLLAALRVGTRRKRPEEKLEEPNTQQELVQQGKRGWKYFGSEWYLRVWLLLIVAFTLTISYAPSRYYVLFYPPLAGLAALQMDAIAGKMLHSVHRRRFCKYKAVILLLGLGCSLNNIYWYSDWLLHLSYRQRDADRWLGAHLPPDSVLIGAVSLGLSMDNRFRCVNVIEGLCNDARPVEKAAPFPRYIIILDRVSDQREHNTRQESTADRWKERYWLRNYPDLIRPEQRLHTFPQMLRPFFTVGVYPVPAAYTGEPQHKEQK